jgi:hypothetical protein
MLVALGTVAALLAAGSDAKDARKLDKRYGLAADLKAYPQGTPKEALASALKAIEKKRVDYLVAHLADPAFIDDRVTRVYGGHFDEQVEDTTARLDPATVKQLRALLKDGTWDIGKREVSVRCKAVKGRCLRLRAVGGRWFLEHPWAEKK